MNDQSYRSRWFPYSYSNNKADIIYKNSQLNCQSEYGCGTMPNCEHRPKWRMFNFDEYFQKDSYDYLTMGCSVSYGSEIKKKLTWRHQLPNSIDLSVPGIGIDAIWHNLKYLMGQDRVKFRKIIILLPNIERKTFRVIRNGLFFNFIRTQQDENNPHHNFAFRPNEMKTLLESQIRYLVLHGKDYGMKMLTRFMEWLTYLEADNIHVSSWDDLVFEKLSKKIKKENLIIKKFPQDHMPDPSIKHPSPQAHQKWLSDIDYIL